MAVQHNCDPLCISKRQSADKKKHIPVGGPLPHERFIIATGCRCFLLLFFFTKKLYSTICCYMLSYVQQLLRDFLFTSLVVVVLSRAERPLLLEIVILGIGVRGPPLLLAARPLWWRMTCLMYPLMAGADPESGEAINPATAPPLFTPLRRCRLLHSHILPRLVYLRSQFEKRGRLADSPVLDKLKSITRPVHRLRNNRSLGKGLLRLRLVPFPFFFAGCQQFKQSSTYNEKQSIHYYKLLNTVNTPFTWEQRTHICPIKSIIIEILAYPPPTLLHAGYKHFVVVEETTKC